MKRTAMDNSALSPTTEHNLFFKKGHSNYAEKLFGLLFDHSCDAVLIHDLDGKIIDANIRAMESSGYCRNEFSNIAVFDLLAGETAADYREALAKNIPGRSFDLQGEFLSKGGNAFPATISSTIFEIGGDKFILGIVRDMSDRKRVEESIAGKDRLLYDILESLTHPFYVIDVKDYTIQIANTASGITDLSEDQYCFAVTHGSDVPCDMNNEICPIKMVSESGKPATVEHIHIGKEGRPRYFEVHAYPIFDGDGKVCRVIEYSLDVTERRRAEEQLQTEKAYFEGLFESAPEAIVVVENNGRIIRCNSEFSRTFGYTNSEAKGRNIDDLLGSDLYYDEACMTTRRLADGFQVNIETKRKHKDGRYVEVSILATPIKVGSGQVAFYAIYRDISDRKKAYRERLELREKLTQAQRMESLGVLAGGVAHDLNNILGPLVAYPELMRMQLPPESPLLDKVTKIEKSAKRAADVVQDLLTMARRGRYEMIPLNMNDVIKSYINSADYASLKSRFPDTKLNLNLDEDIPLTAGSSTHLYKVMMNLILNAYDAMPRGGELDIGTRCAFINKLANGFSDFDSGKYNIISVSDSGVGMSENDLRHIFEPFYSKKKMGRSGSGLGLSIVYGVIKDHNGYIDVRSEPDKGSEFLIYLPALEKTEPIKNDETVMDIRGSEKVLVVDDIVEQSELAATVLSSFGYQVKTASSGEEALEYLKKNRADVVILDMIMDPGMDGLDTYKEILKIHPRQKAIIVTGFSETDRVKEAEKLGAGKTVRKPYTMQVLGKAIREALGSRAVRKTAV